MVDLWLFVLKQQEEQQSKRDRPSNCHIVSDGLTSMA